MYDWLNHPKVEEVEPKVYALLLRSNENAGHHAVFCAVAYTLDQAHKTAVEKLLKEGAIEHPRFALVAYHILGFDEIKKYADANAPKPKPLETKMVKAEPTNEHNQLMQRIIESGDSALLDDSRHLFKQHEVDYIVDEIAKRKRGAV